MAPIIANAPFLTLRMIWADSAVLVTIAVPVFNESVTVAAVIRRLLEVPLSASRGILVVTDGTREVLDALPLDASVRIIHAPKNGGSDGRCGSAWLRRAAR